MRGKQAAGPERAASDWAVWTRVEGVGRPALDLMHARLVHHRYAPHTHEEYAVGACTGGTEVIGYRGGQHHAGPGTLVVVEPGEAHTGGPAEPAGFTYRVLYPPAGLLAELLGTPDRPPHFPDLVMHDPELAAALRAAHAALGVSGGSADTGEALEADSRLVEVLAALVRRHSASGASLGAGRAPGAVAGSVMSMLADRMARPPTLAELATEFGLSRHQLLRAFRDEVGMPPYAWLAQHRVAHARGLLERGGQLAEVAARVGFADQAHLTRWFRRVVGVTPGAYRNSVQDLTRGSPRP